MKLTRTTFFLGCLVGGLGAAALPLLVQFFSQPTQADTKLLPFQGRLTDAAGNAIGDGARVVGYQNVRCSDETRPESACVNCRIKY